MTKIMTDMDRAVRCLKLQERICTAEAEVLQLQAKVAFRDDDDDTAVLEQIEALGSEIKAMKAEQAACSAAMKVVPNLADAIVAHSKVRA